MQMLNNNTLILSLWILLSFLSCNSVNKTNNIIFEEKAGISRDLVYVTFSLLKNKNAEITLKEATNGTILKAVKLNKNSCKDSSTYIVPLSISAHGILTYKLTNSNPKEDISKLRVDGNGVAVTVENNYFIANLKPNIKTKKGLFSGHLSEILIKNKQILLKRSQNNIHWAPNFQKDSMEYKNIGHVNNVSAQIIENNLYTFEISKSGVVPKYEEINLYDKYIFYANLPYFEYSSTISFNKDVELILLRNDEMTLDSLFTDLIYPDTKGKVKNIHLYNQARLDSLTKSPLADNIEWIGFVNKKKDYGFISIRLLYDNHNIYGGNSPLDEPNTKISNGKNNGRYWNRRLISKNKTLIPKGSRYKERNVYYILDNLDNLSDNINYYVKSLKSPIVVSYK